MANSQTSNGQLGSSQAADHVQLDHGRDEQHAAGRRKARSAGQARGERSVLRGRVHLQRRFPRNFIRLAGTPSFSLGQGPNDVSGPWHCRFGSYHPGLCQFVLADGHVTALNNSIDMNTLQALAVINDGQVVPNY